MRAALAFPFAAMLALSACGAGTDRPAIEVEEAVVRLPALAGRPAAAYFTLRAYRTDIRLTGVDSDDAGRVELHDSRMENGVMRMVPLTLPVTIPAGGEIAFEPGGQHAMLFDVGPDARPGGRVHLRFHFDGLDPIDVQAETRAAGDPA